MSVRRLAADQPDSFTFSADNARWAKAQIKKYPKGREASAVIPLLWRAQDQNGGWVSEPAIRHVAAMLDMADIRVLEIATFYTMFNLAPVGKYYVQLCGTTPCWLRGSDEIKAVCRRVIGEPGQITDDGVFSWIEVECLGACVNAPMVQINDDYYEDLDGPRFEKLLSDLKAGRPVQTGPQVSRHTSAPVSGFTSLIDETLYKNGGAKLAAKPAAAKNGTAAKTNPAKSAVKPAAKKTQAKPKAGKPRGLKAARKTGADDLKQISGVGPKIEGLLNELGVFHFDQIASWKQANVDWVDDYLSFKGRIARDDWIAQAKKLSGGR